MKPTVSWIPWRNSDLRSYLRHAQLPEMTFSERAPEPPRDGFKSHLNKLKVTPEHFRQLESIRRMQANQLAENIAAMLDVCVPRDSLTVDEVCDYNRSGERLTVPASNFKINIPEYSLNRPENISHIATWLENYPLATVQRAMHLTYPDSKAWVCQMDDSTHDDQDILRYFTWSAPVAGTSSRGVKNRQTSVVVIYQPPWILSSEDVERFVLCDSHPSYGRDAKVKPNYHSKHKLWAKVWDLCFANMCTYFVLTNYDDWVFGNFSLGWSNAYVSRIIRYSSPRPTITEALVYWFASSMGKPGGWAPWSLPESVAQVDPPSIHHPSETPSSEAVASSAECPDWASGVKRPSRMPSTPIPDAALAVLRPASRCSSASSACGEDASHAVSVIRTTKLTRLARKASVAVPSRRIQQHLRAFVTPDRDEDPDIHNDLPTYGGNVRLLQPIPLRAGIIALFEPEDVPAGSGDDQSTVVGPVDMVPQDSVLSDAELLGIPPQDRTIAWVGYQIGHPVNPGQFAGFFPPIASPAPSNYSERSHVSTASTVRDLFSSTPKLETVQEHGVWTAPSVCPFNPVA